MCLKPLKKSEVKKILVILLSNIGDVAVTLPVLDILIQEFPQSQISVVIGPKGESLFQKNPRIQPVYIFDKHQSWLKTMALIAQLRQQHFDVVIDLRNTAIPFFLTPKFRTSFFYPRTRNRHMRLFHLDRLRSVIPFEEATIVKKSLYISQEEQRYTTNLIKTKIGEDTRFCVICPSAADHRKRWPSENFAALGDRLVSTYGLKIVLVGEGEGEGIVDQIAQQMHQPSVKLKGETTLIQLAELMKKASLVVANDSGAMHLASYLNVPVLALFGPTEPQFAAPWSTKSFYLHKNDHCQACRNPRLHFEHTCMQAISAEEAFEVIGVSAEGIYFKR